MHFMIFGSGDIKRLFPYSSVCSQFLGYFSSPNLSFSSSSSHSTNGSNSAIHTAVIRANSLSLPCPCLHMHPVPQSSDPLHSNLSQPPIHYSLQLVTEQIYKYCKMSETQYFSLKNSEKKPAQKTSKSHFCRAILGKGDKSTS